jgi:hypothetical protein
MVEAELGARRSIASEIFDDLGKPVLHRSLSQSGGSGKYGEQEERGESHDRTSVNAPINVVTRR